MKRILTVVLTVCLLLTSLNTLAATTRETIDTIEMTVSGFEIGAKKTDVNVALSDERLEVKTKIFTGNFGDGDTFLEQKSYQMHIIVSIKSDLNAKFSKDITAKDVVCHGIDDTPQFELADNRNFVMMGFSLKTAKSAETIAKEEAIEAAKHKHCFCGGYIETSEHSEHSEVTFKNWNGTDQITYNSNGEAYVVLTKDAQRCSTLSVGGKKSLTICLNGHSLKMGRQDRVINVNVGGKLRICDCQRSADATISGGYAEYGGGIHNNGTVNMYGGVVTQNEGGYGGGVYNNANFYLHGGDIYDNKAWYGGGVWNDNDSSKTFTMYNGTISLNSAGCGGAVWNNDGANLSLKGGNVSKNVVGTGGGAVWNNGGTVEIDGAMLLENVANYGGAIWNNGKGIVNMKSGNISKNVATTNLLETNGYGGGIWNNGDAIVNMTGGEITFNRAYMGGGLWLNADSEFVMSGGVVAENEAIDGAGLYIQAGDETGPCAVARLSGKAGLVMNYAVNHGGGAYVKGTLNFSDEAEAVLNESSDPATSNIYVAESGVVNQNYTMPTQFIDVNYGDYFLEPLIWALENNLTSGTSDVTFSPNDKCTRGQVITFIYRLHGSPKTDGFYFADTIPSDYFYDATRWAREKKMESGSTFSPNNYCARCDVIRYMWIAAGSPVVDTHVPFTDVPADSNYAMAVAWAVENGITSGTSATTFSPNDKITRAQAITFLYRAFGK